MGNKIIDLKKLNEARALLDSAIQSNPKVLDRLTLEDIEMVYQSELDTTVISVRMDRKIVERLDQYARELAVKEKRRVTRNMMFNELTVLALNILEGESNEQET